MIPGLQEGARLLRVLADMTGRYGPLAESVALGAREIQATAEATEVRIYTCLLEQGRDPDEHSPVVAGHSDGTSAACSIADIDLDGHLTVVGDRRISTSRWIDRDPGGSFVVRVRRPGSLTWVVLRWADDVPESDRDVWADFLTLVVDGLLAPYEADSEVQRRRRFFVQLHEIDPDDLTLDLCRLCDLWKVATGADWVWLWTYNESAEIYELAARSDLQTQFDQTISEALERFTPRGNGVGHYACKRCEPVHVDEDIAGWRRSIDGASYQVMLAKTIGRAGAAALTMVPLACKPGCEDLRDVIGLYYRSEHPARIQSDQSMMMMGRATARFVQTASDAQNQRIQAAINELAQKHLVGDGPPDRARQSFLDGLIEELRKVLSCEGVSVFLKAEYDDHVFCVATSGLRDASGERVRKYLLPTVEYRAGEGVTGSVVATKEPFLSPNDVLVAERKPRSVEIRPSNDDDPIESILIQPILDDPSRGSEAALLGLIRVVDHRSPLLPERLSHFRPSDLRMLAFVAEQISPIIQALNQRIEREHTISLVKHDLSAPMEMIRDTMRKIQRMFASPDSPIVRDVGNVLSSVYRTLNLSARLELKQPTAEDLQLGSTKLEGDIIARVKAMMGHYVRANHMDIRFSDQIRKVPALLLDIGMIERVIVNLIVNAVKYGKKYSVIRIEARPIEHDSRYYVLDISNHGIGIEEKEKELVFLPRFRSSKAIDVGPGDGLGLSISRHLMRLHGGRLELTQGRNPTVFSIYFPRSARVGAF